MRLAVRALAIKHEGSAAGGSVTISIGVAVVQPTSERRSRGALQLADQALYEAKVRGRNRVELLGDSAHRLLVTGVFAAAAAGLVGGLFPALRAARLPVATALRGT